MNGFVGEFQDWATQPFSADMDVSHWVMFIGLLLIIALFWNIALSHLVDALKG